MCIYVSVYDVKLGWRDGIWDWGAKDLVVWMVIYIEFSRKGNGRCVSIDGLVTRKKNRICNRLQDHDLYNLPSYWTAIVILFVWEYMHEIIYKLQIPSRSNKRSPLPSTISLPLLHPLLYKLNLLALYFLNCLWRKALSGLVCKNSIFIPMMYRSFDQDERLVNGWGAIMCGSIERRSVRSSRTPNILFAIDICQSWVREIETTVFVNIFNSRGSCDVERFSTDDWKVGKINCSREERKLICGDGSTVLKVSPFGTVLIRPETPVLRCIILCVESRIMGRVARILVGGTITVVSGSVIWEFVSVCRYKRNLDGSSYQSTNQSNLNMGLSSCWAENHNHPSWATFGLPL